MQSTQENTSTPQHFMHWTQDPDLPLISLMSRFKVPGDPTKCR